jgi:hypothetical protein
MNLLETMRRRRVNALIEDAHYLASLETSAERKEAIEREKRRAMYRAALGEITYEERDAIFEVLSGRNGDVQ